jgi:hypothetical protein
MYVALTRRSKNTACMRCDNLHRIFRKLRLAVFGRMCRLPIGLGSLWARMRGWFPILRCRMSGVANGIAVATAGDAPLSLRQSRPYSGPFLAGCPQPAEKSERQPGPLATHRAGRAYYIYVASRKCQPRHFGWQPQGGFWQTDHLLQAIPAKPRNKQQRSGGDRATQASSLKSPFGRASIVARQAR